MSQRTTKLLSELTLEEMAALTAGIDMWRGPGVPRLGVSPLKVSDGPSGVRGERWVGTTSACVPCATALGSTWNPSAVAAVGEVLAAECHSKDIDILLAPTVNLHRHPLAGRNFECYSEDPLLTAELAVGFINALQSAGVGACIKHFVANDSEFERMTISSEVAEIPLRELYLFPFERAVAAGVAAVMSAYNKLNGTSCAQNTWLLSTLLKQEWGFDGVVISDWWGTYEDTAAAAGLDVEMPGPATHMGEVLAERVNSGELDIEVLEDKARRILSTMERLGVLDRPDRGAERSLDDPAHHQVLRRVASEGIVLLRNEPVDGVPLLPLSPAHTKVALIGPNCDAETVLGGGSASMNPHYVVTVRDALIQRLGPDVEIVHERGVDSARTAHPLPERWTDGITVEYFANRNWDGDPVLTEQATNLRLVWMGDFKPEVPQGNFSVRASTSLRVPEAGRWTLTLVTGGAGRVMLDGAVVLDNFEHREPGTEFFGLGSAEISVEVDLSSEQAHTLVAEYECIEGLGVGALLVGVKAPLAEDAIARAAGAASESDVAIVVVGLDQSWEGEGGNRDDLSLPGQQAELMSAVIAANPRTVVVLNSGSIVDIAGAEEAPALLQSWYLGQEHGNAVVDVLCGDVDPGGRLPMTWGSNVVDWASNEGYPGTDGKVNYGEGLLVGYRDVDTNGTQPEFPFGHGLSYGSTEWGEPEGLPSSATEADLQQGLCIRVPITNLSSRHVSEVVQLYVAHPEVFAGRPKQELRAFAKVHLAPHETVTAELVLNDRSVSRWDPPTHSWAMMDGTHELRLARSSANVVATWLLEVIGDN